MLEWAMLGFDILDLDSNLFAFPFFTVLPSNYAGSEVDGLLLWRLNFFPGGVTRWQEFMISVEAEQYCERSMESSKSRYSEDAELIP
jgi:hypothetical protein